MKLTWDARLYFYRVLKLLRVLILSTSVQVEVDVCAYSSSTCTTVQDEGVLYVVRVLVPQRTCSRRADTEYKYVPVLLFKLKLIWKSTIYEHYCRNYYCAY